MTAYLSGQKIGQNRSTSHHFQDKCLFAFHTEIQDDRKQMQETDFWEKK